MSVFRFLLPILLTASFAAAQTTSRDGQHDFDFEIGTWKTHLRRLQKPLSKSSTWVEYDGTTVVTKVLEVNSEGVSWSVGG